MNFTRIGAYIDSLIPLAAGAYCIFRGYFSSRADGAGIKKLFRIGGPVMLITGSLMLLAESSTTWKRIVTDDGMASAEFPGKPKRRESVDSSAGIPIKQVSYTYDVPGRDVHLFLSISPINDPEPTDDQRIDMLAAHLAQQGLELSAREPVECGDVPGYFLRGHNQDETAIALCRMVFHESVAYRVIASGDPKIEADEDVRRFLTSFRVGRPVHDNASQRHGASRGR